MKQYLFLAAAVGLALVLIPALFCAKAEGDGEPTAETQTPSTAAAADEESIAVFMAQTGVCETLSMREYAICVLAGEMPAAYDENALKAQALACVTLARYMQLHNRNNASLAGGVISTDPGSYQGYMSREEMRERWGDRFDECYQKLCDAVDEVLPYALYYNGEPILAAFHAISPGRTESAEVVWGDDIPYLVSCESEGDRLSPGYASSLTVSPDELSETLGLTSDGSPEDWLGESAFTEAGTLLHIEICGKAFTGAGLRKAFSLRSAAVTLRFDGESFVFDVTGYGHGVGLSQYGADYYARQGMDWRQIALHYYPGAEIVRYERTAEE